MNAGNHAHRHSHGDLGSQHSHLSPTPPDGRTDHAEHDAPTAQQGRGSHRDHERHSGHEGHSGHGDHVAQFRRLFWINLLIAVPVVVFSPMFAMLLGYSIPEFPGAAWIAPFLGTVMYVWGGRPFLTGAVSEIRSRQPGMMLLIGLAITVAFLASWGATLGILDHQLEFWWELALLVVIMLLGHWVEMRSLAQTTSALDSLAALLPDTAERIEGDDLVSVSPTELRHGDLVLVRPGANIPADGTIREGRADVDESMVTGESRPVTRSTGESVVAGTVATDSSLRIEVTATGDDTALAGIQRLVTEAQNSSSRAQRIADTAAAWLFWFALGAAVITAITWSLLGMPDDAVVRTVTVLVIACPHALGLAIPAGRLDRDGTGRPRRSPGEGPAGAGSDAHRRHRPVRQDRHPHQGRARPRRGHRSRRARDRGAGPAAAAEGGERAPARARHRRQGPGRRDPDPSGLRHHAPPPLWESAPRWTDTRSASAAPDCSRRPEPARSQRPRPGVRRERSSSTSSVTAT